MVKRRPQRVEETILTKHGELGTVNGWRAGWEGGGYGVGEMSIQSIGEMGKDFCPKPSPTSSSKNIDRRSCNDGSRELSPIFYNPLRRRWLVPWTTL